MWITRNGVEFRFWAPTQDLVLEQRQFPLSIRRLGARVTLYAAGVRYLGERGNPDAKCAFSCLLNEATKLQGKTRRELEQTLECGDLALFSTLHHAARWRLDSPGIVALQLLLHVWIAKASDQPHRFLGSAPRSLTTFKGTNRDDWWRLAKPMFDLIVSKPLAHDAIRGWVPASSPRPVWEVNRRLRDRFFSFASKA